jgi:hypothetical protein
VLLAADAGGIAAVVTFDAPVPLVVSIFVPANDVAVLLSVAVVVFVVAVFSGAAGLVTELVEDALVVEALSVEAVVDRIEAVKTLPVELVPVVVAPVFVAVPDAGVVVTVLAVDVFDPDVALAVSLVEVPYMLDVPAFAAAIVDPASDLPFLS